MLKIGHRGAKAYAPENTLASFQKALEIGVDMIEFDIRITRDRHPVVLHDRSLTRLAKKFRSVDRLTLRQLKELRIKEEHPIPTLGEALESLGNEVGMNIELKVRGSAQIVVQTLRDYHIDFSRVMISSNFPAELKEIERLEPEITTALIFRATNAFSFWFILDFLALVFLPLTRYYIVWVVRHARADYLSINHVLLNRRKVELLKRHGIKICAWTVDSPKKIEYLKQLGVDGIITNYPDRL